MPELSSYIDKYPEFAIERKEGVLHLRFHTGGKAFCWSASGHRQLEGRRACRISTPIPENRVLLLSGTGADFLGSIDLPSFKGISWDTITWEGKRYLSALLGLEIPAVAAVEGRCTIHAGNSAAERRYSCFDEPQGVRRSRACAAQRSPG